MTETEHLLSCLAEECAEVAQRVSKALRFGLNEVQPGQALTNADRIINEMADLTGVARLLTSRGILGRISMEDYRAMEDRKSEKVERFMVYAREQGTLQ